MTHTNNVIDTPLTRYVFPVLLMMATPATPKPEATEFLNDFEEELSCHVCLGPYSQPRLLPCFHVFCLSCLERLPTKMEDGHRVLHCPSCRQPTQLPDKGPEGLTTAFHINNLMELFQTVKKVLGEGNQASCDNCNKAVSPCAFCKQCDKLLCQECVDLHAGWGAFQSHEIISKDKIRTDAIKRVPLKKREVAKCTDHDKSMKIFCETCQMLICRDCTVRIHKDHVYDLVSDRIKNRQDQILEKLKVVKEHAATITGIVNEVSVKEENMIKESEMIKFMITSTMQQICKKIEASSKELVAQVDALLQAKLEDMREQKKEANIILSQLTNCQHYVEEEIRIASPEEIVSAAKEMEERISAVSRTVKMESLKPKESPPIKFISYEDRFLQQIGKIVVDIPLKGLYGLNGPSAIAVGKDGRIYVTESNANRVTVFNQDGKKLSHFGTDVGMSEPRGIALTESRVYVATKHSHSVFVFSHEGVPIGVIGQRGKGPLQFFYPYNVYIDVEGFIYISDQHNCRVQILNPDHTVRCIFGSKGNGPGQFTYPMGIAVDSEGFVYVCDNNNSRVQVFTKKGAFVRELGQGILVDPRNIFISPDNLVHVTDVRKCKVLVFSTNGDHLKSYGTGKGKGPRELTTPRGVAVLNTGHVLVCDRSKNEVVVFNDY